MNMKIDAVELCALQQEQANENAGYWIEINEMK